MHACKNKCWFSANKTYCSPCNRKRKEETIIDALNGNSVEVLIQILEDKGFEELMTKNDTLDNMLRKIYILNKDFLYHYLCKMQGTVAESNLISRIHTHSNTFLCTIVGWMIRRRIYDSSINICCLRCMSHLIRYGTAVDANNVKYSIQFELYGPEHINIRGAVAKNAKDLYLLTEMANAIIERYAESEGLLNKSIYSKYNDIVSKNISISDYNLYKQSINTHPILHKATLEDKIYCGELITKSMHPSRVMQWCMTEDQKNGYSEIPKYTFSDGIAPWNIEV
jgi:hypothetical protein